MATPDQQQPADVAPTQAEGTIIHLLLQAQAGLADIALIALRIEDKVDMLLDALAEEDEGEPDPEQTTLDGEPMGAERKEGTPL